MVKSCLGKRYLPISLLILVGIGLPQSAQIVVTNADANGNHTPETQITPDRGVGGEAWTNTLVPSPFLAIGPGATQSESKRLEDAFQRPEGGRDGWVFNNGSGIQTGSFQVNHYDAFLLDPTTPTEAPGAPAPLPHPPLPWDDCNITVAGGNKDCFTVTYSHNANPVAPNVLRWIQFVCTNWPTGAARDAFTDPECDPDNEANGYIDGLTTDEVPFYYLEAWHALHSGAGDTPPITFYDRPQRGFPVGRTPIKWRARLYLVEWNSCVPGTGCGNGVVTVHQGVEWGFELNCISIGNPVSTFQGGGVDRDIPLEIDKPGPEPVGPPSEGCSVAKVVPDPMFDFTVRQNGKPAIGADQLDITEVSVEFNLEKLTFVVSVKRPLILPEQQALQRIGCYIDTNADAAFEPSFRPLHFDFLALTSWLPQDPFGRLERLATTEGSSFMTMEAVVEGNKLTMSIPFKNLNKPKTIHWVCFTELQEPGIKDIVDLVPNHGVADP